MNRPDRFRFGTCALAIAFALFYPSHFARADELLSNGGFESEPNFGSGVSGDAGYSALTGSQIPGWTIVPNHAATVHNTVLYPTISGNYSVNMDGEGFMGHNADLYQDFSTILNASYAFAFDWQGWMTMRLTHSCQSPSLIW